MIAFRPVAPFDMKLVLDAWVSSFRTSHTAGMLSPSRYRLAQWAQCEEIIAMPNTRTIVAYETDDDDHIADLYGFICVDLAGSPPIAWYVYTKEAFRRMGIARKLFAAAGINPDLPFVYGYKTAIVAELRDLRKIQMARFTPTPLRHDNPRRDDESPRESESRSRQRPEASSPVVEYRRPR